jgi:hypothetical protein
VRQFAAPAVPETLDQPTLPAGNGAEETAEPGEKAVSPTQAQRLFEKGQMWALLITTVVLAAGLALLWITKTVVGIEGDAVFIALLLVPVLVFLSTTGKLQSFTLGPASAVFRELEEVHGSVKEVGQREEKRAAYLGKLGQVLEKDKRRFALIYADVDGLRSVMREIYLAERGRKGGKASAPARRREEEIRDEVLDRLEFALTDAFYDANLDEAKCDVFRLVEPDVAMIVRCDKPHRAHEVAERAEVLFREAKGCTATTVVVPATHLGGELTPEFVDDIAGQALAEAKDERKNGR